MLTECIKIRISRLKNKKKHSGEGTTPPQAIPPVRRGHRIHVTPPHNKPLFHSQPRAGPQK